MDLALSDKAIELLKELGWQRNVDNICSAPVLRIGEPDSEVIHPAFLFNYYWRGLAANAETAIPQRAQFRPQQVPEVLPWIMLFECIQEPEQIRYRVRLQGRSAAELTHGCKEGMYLEDFTMDECRSSRRQMFEIAAASGQPFFANVHPRSTMADTGGSEFRVTSDLGAFPFLNSEGKVGQIMVVVAPSDPKLRGYLLTY